MGQVLFELEQTLLSSKSKITREEADVLNICKAKALRDFTVTACITSAITWTALRKLNYGFRGSLSSGAGALSGMWKFNGCLDSCVDNILAMEGSRMQKELAKIILTKHQHDPSSMQLLNKHFYPEQVFDDSCSDHPVSRWRHRRYYIDNATLNSRTRDDGDGCANNENSDLETKQLPVHQQMTMGPAVGLDADPLDCIFGNSNPPEEIHLSKSSTEGLPKRGTTRRQKRAQRRHRRHHTEASSDADS